MTAEWLRHDARRIPAAEFLTLPMDLLLPCARNRGIHGGNAFQWAMRRGEEMHHRGRFSFPGLFREAGLELHRRGLASKALVRALAGRCFERRFI